MAYTAALQAAIALIRKHEATSSEVDAFLSAQSDLTVNNNLTGKTREHVGMVPGTIIDAGAGITYEAPISSINASNAVNVLRAELRAVAASLMMPEYMLSADLSNASFASTLVAEAPFVKHMEAEQRSFGQFWRKIIWTAVRHEVFWGRLPSNVLDDYKLVGEFTSLVVRDFLQEAQTRDIEFRAGVLSIKTWRGLAGYDDETERKNIEEDPGNLGEEPEKVGGKDQTGNTDDPGSADGSKAFSPVEQ
jgi:hypothetical protein